MPNWIRDPDSAFSAMWDLLQVVLLLYVSITVPYRAALDVDVAFLSMTWWFDVVVDVYFIVDIVLNFRTSFINTTTDVRETSSRLIAKNYLKGWFAIDFISCIPVGHIAFIIEQNELEELGSTADGTNSNSNLRSLKALRLLRLSKMLRLARLKRIMQKYENLMVVQQYIGKTHGCW
eukprot:COSAG04_NODE_298_length_17490_cov_10.214249_13_plen_177_part_00